MSHTMSRTPAAPVLAVLALSLGSAATAQTVVGPAGSGAAFQQLQPALASAPVGSTIRVLPGVYQPFEVTRGVSIVGAGAADTLIAIAAGSAEGAIDVANVPAGETVRISGVGVLPASSSSDARIALTQCQGRVELVGVDSLQIAAGTLRFVDEATLVVDGCATVLLDSCRLHGNFAPTATAWQRGSAAASVSTSNVWFSGCELRGGHGSEGHGGVGLWLADGFGHLSRCDVQGGSGGAHFGFYWWDIYGFAGAEAIRADAAELVLAGGEGNRTEGGYGTQTSSTDWTAGGQGVFLTSGSLLRYAADADIRQGLDGLGNAGAVPIANSQSTSTIDAESVARPTLQCVPASPQPGDVVEVQAQGNANALHFVFAAFDGIAPIALGGGMHVHIDPAVSGLLGFFALDPSGRTVLPVLLPASPSLAGARLVLQSIDSDLSQLRLSNPAQLTVLTP